MNGLGLRLFLRPYLTQNHMEPRVPFDFGGCGCSGFRVLYVDVVIVMKDFCLQVAAGFGANSNLEP